MNENYFEFNQLSCRRSLHGLTECNPKVPCGCGMCAGISLYILTNLYECESENLSPEKAFELTEMYTKMLKMTRNPFTLEPTEMGKFSHLEQSIRILQMRYQTYQKYPFGDFIYSLGHSGFALIEVYACDSINNLPSNSLFLKNANERQDAINNNRYIASNHMGFIVWKDNHLFIFDPNVGGKLIRFSNKDITITPYLIEGNINLMCVESRNPQRVRLVTIFKPNFDVRHKNKDILNNALKDIHSFR
ncbi:hypothetical protein Xbed_00759 [Xenorhabdus beddingii]|uniref:Uncharacterized protein n=1 Tax=Xenorhabdus beddingii TaxID=40578 RepID=A0A1Y2SQN2_9GAMM|nr:hypothetical protein [Xenorhabdus beddingii]OTA21113.1 hypothetical protein Xbed_00759 [Xenorhabdus beddingii]